jgi:hypothetical protein
VKFFTSSVSAVTPARLSESTVAIPLPSSVRLLNVLASASILTSTPSKFGAHLKIVLPGPAPWIVTLGLEINHVLAIVYTPSGISRVEVSYGSCNNMRASAGTESSAATQDCELQMAAIATAQTKWTKGFGA